MAKKSIVDLTRKNREHHKIGSFKFYEQKTLSPQVLLSVYINEEGKVEEVKVLDEFVGERWGRDLRANECNEDFNMDYYDLPPEMSDKDTLYHVYAAIGSYRSSYEYEEYDTYFDFFNPIKVMSNYRAFLEKNEDWAEQERLKALDEGISVDTGGQVYKDEDDEGELIGWDGSNRFSSNITINDIEQLLSIIVKHNIRLAHRFGDYYGLRESLGEQYDENIAKLEGIRQKVIEYIKYQRDVKTRWDSSGYYVTTNLYTLPKGTFFISFDDINNISDEILMKNEPREIMKALISTKHILQTFEKADSL